MSEQWGPQGPTSAQQGHPNGQGPQGHQGGYPQPPAPPQGRRWGIWIAVGCLALLLVLLLIATIGGVVYLVGRDGPEDPPATTSAPATVTSTGTTFTLTHPDTWAEGERTPDTGMELNLRRTAGQEEDDDGMQHGDNVTVYQFQSERQAVAECRWQAPFLGWGFDDHEDAEELDRTEVGGAPAAHHRVHGTWDGRPVVAETWCLDVDGGVLQIVAETYGAEEISSEEAQIVSSLVVTAG